MMGRKRANDRLSPLTEYCLLNAAGHRRGTAWRSWRRLPARSGCSLRQRRTRWSSSRHPEGAYERETIDGSRTAAKTLCVVRKDDLIINKIWVRHGSTAVASEEVDGCAASGELPTFEFDRNRVLPRWIHWLTKTSGFWAKCDALSRGTSGKNRIKPELFLTICVPLPPLEEQRRLVARIERVALQIHEALAVRTESSATTLALERTLPEAEFTKLRSSVGLKRLADVCESITDGDHNTPPFHDSGVPFIFVGNVSSGILHFDGSKRVDEEYFARLRSKRKPERGDILFTAVGATLGIPAIVTTDQPFCFQRHIAILKLRHDIVDTEYVWHILRSQTVFAQAWRQTTGSAQLRKPTDRERLPSADLGIVCQHAKMKEQLAPERGVEEDEEAASRGVEDVHSALARAEQCHVFAPLQMQPRALVIEPVELATQPFPSWRRSPAGPPRESCAWPLPCLHDGYKYGYISRRGAKKGWRRRPDLNRGWRFCRFGAFPILLIRLALWSSLLLGFTWCLGVRGLKLD
jgi:type I restriction enzyme S subunit